MPEATPSAPGRAYRRTLAGLGRRLGLTLTLVLGLTLTLGLLSLGLPAGRQALLDMISRAAQGPALHLEMRGLHFGPTWTLDSLILGDEHGPWLEIQDMAVTPILQDLLQFRISLERLTLGQVLLNRLPQPADKTEATESAGFPALPAMRIGSLEVGLVRLGPDVLGQEAKLAVQGQMCMTPDQTQAGVQVSRVDHSRDKYVLDGTFYPANQHLEVRGQITEQQDGLLHLLLGLHGQAAIAMNATGSGPLSQWALQLHADIADLARLDARLDMNKNEAQPLTAMLQAAVRPGPAWSETLGIVEKDVDLKACFRWANSTVNATDILLRTPQETLSGQLTLDTRTLAITADAEVTADASWAMPATVSAGPATARIALRGSLDALTATSEIHLADWRFGELPVPAAHTQFCLSTFKDGSWRIETDLKAQTPSLPAYLRDWTVRAALGGTLRDPKTVILDSLSLTAPGLRVEADGMLGTATRIEARVRPGTDDQWRLDSRLLAAVQAGTAQGSLELALDGIRHLPRPLALLLGSEARVQTMFDVSAQELQLSKISLQSKTTGEGSARLDWNTQAMAADCNLRFPEIRDTDLHISGTRLTGRLRGAPAAIDLEVNAEAPRVLARGFELEKIKAKAVCTGQPRRRHVSLRAETMLAGEPLTLLAEAGVGPALSVQNCTVTIPQSVLTLAGTLDLSSLLVLGQASLDSRNLHPLGRMLGLDLAGNIQATAIFDSLAGHAGQADRQQIAVKATANGLRLETLELAQARLNGRFSQLSDAHADIALHTVSAGPLRADQISGTLRPGPGGPDFSLALRHALSGTDLHSSGHMAANCMDFTVRELHGKVLRQPVRLISPLELNAAGKNLAWPLVRLEYGPASLHSQGRISADQADITAELNNFDVQMLRPLLTGLPEACVRAQLAISGTRTNPEARLTAQATGIKMPGAGQMPAASAQLHAQCTATALNLRGNLLAESAHVDFNAACPVRASLFSVDIEDSALLSGQITGQADLGLLSGIVPLDDQTLTGIARSEFFLEGTKGAPRLRGLARLEKGRYENFRSGTRVEDLGLEVRAEGASLAVHLTGTDGDQGHVAAQGAVNLDNQTYALNTQLTAYRALRQDLVQATANGTVTMRGDSRAAMLRGALCLDPVEVRLPASTPPDLAQIDVQEINTAHAKASPKAPGPFKLGLDVQIDMPARFSIQGRGLDAQWTGNLHIQGDQHNPIIKGAMYLERGAFDLLDRSFELTKGSLAFNGETPPNPYLDICGETRIQDTLAAVQLLGPARTFRLTMSSTPPLPQDELLSVILFGRSLRQISPFQAVRLAQAAAELTGMQAGPDVLRTLKSGLGLQEVEVGKDEHDNTTVGVGKYIGGKYYVRTQSSLAGQGRTKVEVQISPTISAETEIGADSRQGGGITWTYEY